MYVDPELLSVILFFSGLALYLLKDRKEIEFHYGLIIRRWKGGKERISKFVNKHQKFFRYLGVASIFVSLLASFVGIYFLIYFSIQLKQAFGLVLPKVGKVEYPKPVIGIPFWYWIVGIFFVLFPHETFHAIYAILSRIKVKGYGILLFLIFPLGAFVDIDEKKIKKLSLKEKLQIYSAGSFANFLTFVVFFLFSLAVVYLFNTIYTPIGVNYAVIPNTTAEKIGLSGYIIRINNETIESVDDFASFMMNTKPNETIEIETSNGTFLATLTSHPENSTRGFLGVTSLENVYKNKISNSLASKIEISVFEKTITLFSWVQILSLGVGIANMLPIKPLDGGKIYEELFKHYAKKRWKVFYNIFSLTVLGLLLFNLVGIPLIKHLLS